MKTELDLKRKWVALQNKGYTVDRISELTNSSPTWVRSFLNRNNLKALEKMAEARVAERAKQVRRLEQMIDDAYRAWEQSLLVDEVIETIEEPIGAQSNVNIQRTSSAGGATSYTQIPPAMSLVRTKKTTKYRCGDIAYLKAVQSFMQDIRSILKIDDGTRRVDLSLNIPGDTIQATLNVRDIAAQELHEWNMAQKDRLQQMLEMQPPEISDNDDDDDSITNGDGDIGNDNGT